MRLSGLTLCVFPWFVTCILIFLVIFIPEPSYRIENVRVENNSGKPLQLMIFHPMTPVHKRAPGVVICQPLNNPPEFSRPLALELVRDGFVVLTFDWHGKSPAENRQLIRTNIHAILRADVQAAVSLLKTLPTVDPDRISIAGHSVGGSLAIDAAIDDPTVNAVACIGMETDVPEGKPRNLLWVAGLYDEFRSTKEMHTAYQKSTLVKSDTGDQSGDFSSGTMRGVYISPTADHFTEMFDWRVHREVVTWFRKASGLEEDSRCYWVELRCLVFTAAWLLAFVSGLVSLRMLTSRYPWLRRIVPIVILVVVFFLARTVLNHDERVYELVLYLVLIVPLSGFLYALTSDQLNRGIGFGLRLSFVLWGSILLTLIANTCINYFRHPSYLLYVPEFAIGHVLSWFYAYLLLYTRQLFLTTNVHSGLTIQIWVYCILFVEVVFPGGLLRLTTLFKRRHKKRDKRMQSMSLTHVIAFMVLLAAFVSIAWLRLAQGFVTAESSMAALRFIIRFGIVPACSFAVLWRVYGRLYKRSGKTEPHLD